MGLQQQEQLIVMLAKMPGDRHLTPGAMHYALTLVCEAFSYDCALLYVADEEHDLLHLCEHAGIPTPPPTVPDSCLPKFHAHCTPERMMYCDVRSQPTPEQIRLLSLFGAQSAAILFLSDENGRIYSLTVLCRASPEPLETEALENLRATLSLLTKDITIQTYLNRLCFAQTALEGVLDHTGIDIYVNDFYNHDILYVNESMARPYGGKVQFAGRKCWQVLFPGQTGPCEFCPQSRLIDDTGQPSKVYTWDYQRAFDGSWFRVFSAAFRWADGRLAHVVSSADITDNKNNEALIQYMANYDDLTNLPNRRMLVTECEQRINQELGTLAYLLFFDIDGFKHINDSLGHDAGDEFLVELGKFFSGIPLLKDAIYRNGGDEFVAMLGEGITADHIRDLSRFIHARFQNPWKLKKGLVMCGISIGVSRYPEDGITAEELLCKADQAMYNVKKRGGGGLHFASGHR